MGEALGPQGHRQSPPACAGAGGASGKRGAQLHRRQSEQRQDFALRIDELSLGVAERDAERESERARQLGRRLRAEELGVLAFLVGVVLTTVGAVA